jgi:uncharacterized protein with HEPN domain
MSNSYTRMHHIIWAIDNIHDFGELNLQDIKTFAAVVYFLQIIGEACKKIKPEIKNLAPDVPWKKIQSFRDYAVHEYFALDIEAIGEAIRSLPDLKKRMQQLITYITNEKQSL